MVNQKELMIEDLPESEVWKRYRETGSLKYRNMLVKQYSPLVKYVAGKVSVGMPPNMEYDDLVGFGVLGLIDAIGKFDPSKYVKFKTYAITRIRGAIFDELRSLDWVPRSVRQKSKLLEESVRKLEAKHSRAVTDEELAEDMEINLKELNDLLQKVSVTNLLSLDDIRYKNEEGISILDSVEAHSSGQPETQVERQEIKEIIIKTIKELPEKEKKVLVLYYYEDLTLKEIGKVLNVTESRISQLHTRAIVRLRSRLTGFSRSET